MSEERNEAPRPFKVGDRVRLMPSAVDVGAMRSEVGAIGDILEDDGGDLRFWVRFTPDRAVWVRPIDIEHVTPAPAPEATETWLDGAVRKERDEWKARAEKAELAFRMSIDEVRAAKDDEAAKFERETAARLLAALVMRGAPHIGQHETEPLLSLARQMADHYFPAKERTS